MQLAALPGENLTQLLSVEAERLRPQVRELRVATFGREQPRSATALLARLGEDELAPVGEREPEHRRLRRLRPGSVIPQPAGAHQVDPEDELAVLGGEEEVLAAPPGTRER